MNWIRVARNIGTDARVGRVARACGVRRAEAVGLIVNVLTKLPDEARDGNLAGFDTDELEVWAGWECAAGLFGAAFLEHMCTPDRVVRAWEKHNGAAIRDADKARDRMKRAREERSQIRENKREAPERSPHAPPNVRRTHDEAPERSGLRDGTGRDVTELQTLSGATIPTQSTDPNKATSAGVLRSQQPGLDLGVVDPPAVAKRPKRAKADGADAKWPSFSTEARQALHAEWQTAIGAVRYPQWIAELGPVFGGNVVVGALPVELAKAYRSYLSSVKAGGQGSRFASPAQFSRIVGMLVQAGRDFADDPQSRLEAIDRIVHGRAA
jgi:hypothetical protein